MPTIREKPRSDRRQHRQETAGQSAARRHFVAASGEFVGTFLFLFFAFLGHFMAATQSGESGPKGTPSSQQVIFISLSYGMSLLVTAWTLYRVSGGLFNPAVTLGMVVSGSLPPMRGLVLLPAQILGAICAAAVADVITPGNLALTVQTTLASGMSIAQGVFLEMFLTSQLVLTILMLAAEKSKATFIAPIGIGLALFVVEIAGVYFTGGSVNPARSFGPCVAAAHFQGYHWIYWVGPALGGTLAAGYLRFVKLLGHGKIDEANPGQDSAGGDFDADVEKRRSRQAEEGQATQIYGGAAQHSPRWSESRQAPQYWRADPPQPQPQQQQHQQQQLGRGSNMVSEVDRRSADMNRRRG